MESGRQIKGSVSWKEICCVLRQFSYRKGPKNREDRKGSAFFAYPLRPLRQFLYRKDHNVSESLYRSY
jgi:hypothetical protein